MALGPPEPFLPEGISPRELEAYRTGYQAFRRGYALGAHGEICRLRLRPRAQRYHVVQRQDSSCSGANEAYFSEPERDFTPRVKYRGRASPLRRGVSNDGGNPQDEMEGAALTWPSGTFPIVFVPGSSPQFGPLAPHQVVTDTGLPLFPLTASSSRVQRRGPFAGILEQQQQGTGVQAGWKEAKESPAKASGSRDKDDNETNADDEEKQEMADGQPQFFSFWRWLLDEAGSHPNEEQLPKMPPSQLLEIVRVPWSLEKLLGFGFLLCLDILLHELSFTPLQVALALPRILGAAMAMFSSSGLAGGKKHWLSVTEQCDLVRLSLLLFNLCLLSALFDDSWVYHYIRGESFLKLYVIFNMLEMFERWFRSVGVDLFDLLAASIRQRWNHFVPKYLVALAYCFIHSSMHMVRVLLLTVAINTSSSAVLLLIVTNNFGEIKSTVFKRYEAKSLFPIITSDMVERFYLVVDIIFVLVRLAVSQKRGLASALDISFWVFLLVSIELGTDWVKFCLIFKFSELKTSSTLEIYHQVLVADILLARIATPAASSARSDGGPSSKPVAASTPSAARMPLMPFRGIHSFSHALARRIGFSGVPLSTLVVVHLAMLLQRPCLPSPPQAGYSAATATRLLAGPRSSSTMLAAFLLAVMSFTFLAKLLLSISLLGFAAKRRGSISKGLELFSKIKAL